MACPRNTAIGPLRLAATPTSPSATTSRRPTGQTDHATADVMTMTLLKPGLAATVTIMQSGRRPR
jgi:hypothetical protein